jgi:hypothetical protein
MFQNRLCLRNSWLPLLCVVLLGCDEDKRLVEQSQQSQQRQAAQNHDMAKLNQQVAEGAKRLVEADAKARQDFIQAQQALDRQRAEIVAEQRKLAEQRHRDPIIAGTLSGITILLACLVPLALGIYALSTTYRSDPSDGLAELLVLELAAEQPTLLDVPRLPAPGPAPAALPPAKTTD